MVLIHKRQKGEQKMEDNVSFESNIDFPEVDLGYRIYPTGDFEDRTLDVQINFANGATAVLSRPLVSISRTSKSFKYYFTERWAIDSVSFLDRNVSEETYPGRKNTSFVCQMWDFYAWKEKNVCEWNDWQGKDCPEIYYRWVCPVI